MLVLISSYVPSVRVPRNGPAHEEAVRCHPTFFPALSLKAAAEVSPLRSSIGALSFSKGIPLFFLIPCEPVPSREFEFQVEFLFLPGSGFQMFSPKARGFLKAGRFRGRRKATERGSDLKERLLTWLQN